MLPAHRLAGTRNVGQEDEPRAQTTAERPSSSLEQRREIRKPSPLRHLEWALAFVNSGTQVRVRTLVEQNLNREETPTLDSHVERGVVIDTPLIRVRAER
jgi:hypothetical protein